MFCSNCGATSTGKFCANCGAQIISEATTAPPEARPSIQPQTPTTKSNTKGCVGCLAALLIGGVLLAILANLGEKERQSNGASIASTKPDGTVAKKVQPEKRSVPRRGDIVVANPSYVPAICIETEDGFRRQSAG
jgi:hypothetical protein